MTATTSSPVSVPAGWDSVGPSDCVQVPARAVVNRKELERVLIKAGKIAPRRSPKANLLCLELSYSNGYLKVRASDLENFGEWRIYCDGSDFGPVLVPFEMLKKAAPKPSKYGTDAIIEVSSAGLVISGDYGAQTLPAKVSDAFPLATFGGADARFSVNCQADELRAALLACLECVDNDAGRFALGGVQCEIEGGKLITVATDGRRLTKCETVNLGDSDSGRESLIIPSRAVEAICAELKDHKEALIGLYFHRNEVQLSCAGGEITSRLLDGRFPRWRDVIPAPETVTDCGATFPAGDLLAALRPIISTINKSDEDNVRGVDFNFDGSDLILKRAGAIVGRLPLLKSTFGPFAVTVDPFFMIDFLSSQDKKTVIQWDGAKDKRGDVEGPQVLRPSSDSVFLVMPMGRGK
jgi:DNA polymerase III subunit beta